MQNENNDLISRDALKKAIKDNGYSHYFEIFNIIDNAPTVEAFTKDDMTGAYNEGYACGSRENERPQGEWAFEFGNQVGLEALVCTNCGHHIYNNGFINLSNLPKFCEDCGAKMQKGGAE